MNKLKHTKGFISNNLVLKDDHLILLLIGLGLS